MNNNYMYVLIADSIQFSPGYGENFILLSGEKWRRKHGQKKKKILLICTLTYRQKNVLRIIKDFRKISIRSSWSIVSFKVCVSLLIFSLVDLFIVVSGVLKSPTIIVLLLISSFILISICLTYCRAPMLGAYIFIIVISSSWIDPLIIM